MASSRSEGGVEHIDNMLHYTRDSSKLIAEYWHELPNISPCSQVKPGFLLQRLPLEAPEKGEEWKDVIDDVKKLIFPGMTHWQSPHFHAFVEAGMSAEGIAADQLIAALCQVPFSWMSSPAATELEMQMTDWLGRMINLPDEFMFSSGKGNGGGVIQESVSVCCLLMLTAAKRRVFNDLQRGDPSLDSFDITPRLVGFTSDQGHLSFERSGIIAGIRFEILETDRNGALRGDTLKKAIQQARGRGLIPTFVGATLGTTTSCAFDNLVELGPICHDEGVWLHIDAAIAGTAFICPEFRPLLEGIQYADSFSCSPHKTMLVSLNCSIVWVKDRNLVESNLDVSSPMMGYQRPESFPDYRRWSLNTGRPFRALKLWFAMRLLGVKGLQDHVKKQVRLLHEFEDLLRGDDRFEICAEVIIQVVCFKLKGFDNDVNTKLLTRINDAGKVYLTSSVLKEEVVIRFAVSNPFTEVEHVHFAWQEIQTAATKLLKEMEEKSEWV